MVDPQPQRAWYAQGLRFECTRCGRCCSGPAEGSIWVDKQEIERISLFLGMPVSQFCTNFLRQDGYRYSITEDAATNDCIFLRGQGPERLCHIYPVRPRQCRTWPFWPSNLRSPSCWYQARLTCPGMDAGPIYSYDQIQRIVGDSDCHL